MDIRFSRFPLIFGFSGRSATGLAYALAALVCLVYLVYS